MHIIGQTHCVCDLRMRACSECVCVCVCVCGVRGDSWPLPGHLVPVTTLCVCVSTSLVSPAQLCPPIRYLVRPLVRAVTEHQRGPCRCLMQGACKACVAAWWYDILEEANSLRASHMERFWISSKREVMM